MEDDSDSERDTQQQYWFWHKDGPVELKQPSGKWMLFYRNEDIEDAWAKAKNNFKKLKMAGIPAMKCSNLAIKNPRATNHNTQIIVFYCGPSTDKKKMKKIGKKLIKIMEYKSPSANKIFYKADYQTFAGTRATGSKSNHLYKLPVDRLWTHVESDQDDDDNEERPATESNVMVFTKTKPEWAYKISGLPAIRLHIKPDHINGEWKRAKDLLMSDSFIKECVAVDCQTMKAVSACQNMLLRMKFYLNIQVSQYEPVQIKNFIRQIYGKMKFVSDSSIGLYEFRKQKPIVWIDNVENMDV